MPLFQLEDEVELMGNKGRQPQRICIVCRSKRAKAELMRLALDDESKVCLDQQHHHHGRGGYVCPIPECLVRVRLAHLEKAFRRPLSEDAWNPGIAMAAALKGCGPHFQGN